MATTDVTQLTPAQQQKDLNLLSRLNPDYVRNMALSHSTARQMLLSTEPLSVVFHSPKNARLWIITQITQCILRSSTVPPQQDQVRQLAMDIWHLYSHRPIAHLALYFGYAQVGLHFVDQDVITHYGVFDLTKLMGHLAHHMDVVSRKADYLLSKRKRKLEELSYWQEIVDGKNIIPIEDDMKREQIRQSQVEHARMMLHITQKELDQIE